MSRIGNFVLDVVARYNKDGIEWQFVYDVTNEKARDAMYITLSRIPTVRVFDVSKYVAIYSSSEYHLSR